MKVEGERDHAHIFYVSALLVLPPPFFCSLSQRFRSAFSLLHAARFAAVNSSAVGSLRFYLAALSMGIAATHISASCTKRPIVAATGVVPGGIYI